VSAAVAAVAVPGGRPQRLGWELSKGSIPLYGCRQHDQFAGPAAVALSYRGGRDLRLDHLIQPEVAVTRSRSCPRRAGLAARVALVCAWVIVAALAGAAAGGSAAAVPSGSASGAETLRMSSADGVDGLSTTDTAAVEGPARTNSARLRLRTAGLTTAAVGLAAIALLGSGPRPVRRPRRRHVVPDDDGDRWRALLIGAPPALFPF
jgi:hypothetical protein